jgi:serine/threonine protein kinase
VTDIFYQLAGGVEFLHEECKMAHCDIKGENIIVTPDGRPVLTDFGNARLVTSEDYLQRGSILYRSPEELLLTNKPAGKASDIWAMGLLLYQALSGKYPFETNPPDWSGKKGEELEQLTAELKMNIALDNIAPISRYNPGVPDNLKAIIKGALKRHPDQRWRIRRIVEALEDQRSLLEEQAKAGRPLT